MSGQSRLSKTYGEFVLETNELLEAFTCDKPNEKGIRSKWPALAVNVAEGCVIRLYDSWSRFCREIIIQSASELPLTWTGAVIARAHGVSRRSDVMTVLFSKLKPKPRYGEPRWADANECLNAAKVLGVMNYGAISAAIGATPSPADDIRTTRNFVAHRNQKTAVELRSVVTSYGLSGTQVEPYLRYVVDPGITIFEKWILTLRDLAEAAIQ